MIQEVKQATWEGEGVLLTNNADQEMKDVAPFGGYQVRGRDTEANDWIDAFISDLFSDEAPGPSGPDRPRHPGDVAGRHPEPWHSGPIQSAVPAPDEASAATRQVPQQLEQPEQGLFTFELDIDALTSPAAKGTYDSEGKALVLADLADAPTGRVEGSRSAGSAAGATYGAGGDPSRAAALQHGCDTGAAPLRSGREPLRVRPQASVDDAPSRRDASIGLHDVHRHEAQQDTDAEALGTRVLQALLHQGAGPELAPRPLPGAFPGSGAGVESAEAPDECERRRPKTCTGAHACSPHDPCTSGRSGPPDQFETGPARHPSAFQTLEPTDLSPPSLDSDLGGRRSPADEEASVAEDGESSAELRPADSQGQGRQYSASLGVPGGIELDCFGAQAPPIARARMSQKSRRRAPSPKRRYAHRSPSPQTGRDHSASGPPRPRLTRPAPPRARTRRSSDAARCAVCCAPSLPPLSLSL